MTLTQSETRKQGTHRPETELLASFLNKVGIEAVSEHPIDSEQYRCIDCGHIFYYPSEADAHEQDRKHTVEEMHYFLDVYLPKFKIAIESNGKIHERAGAQKHDAERKDFLESRGIRVCEIPSSFLLTKGEPDYDKIEMVALLIKNCLEVSK